MICFQEMAKQSAMEQLYPGNSDDEDSYDDMEAILSLAFDFRGLLTWHCMPCPVAFQHVNGPGRCNRPGAKSGFLLDFRFNPQTDAEIVIECRFQKLATAACLFT